MFMRTTTRAQREAVFKVFCRDNPDATLKTPATRAAYRAFRRGFRRYTGGYIGGMWKGMFLGIETDGYTHS